MVIQAAFPLRANFRDARPMDVNERGEFFALALYDGRFVKVSADVKRIIECLVAEPPVTDPEEIAEQLRQEGAADLQSSEIERLIESVLLPQEIVVPSDGSTPRGIESRGSRLWFHFKLFDGRSLGATAKFVTFLFSRQWAIGAGVLWLLLTAALLAQGAHHVLLSTESYRFSLAQFLLLVVPALVIHELGHAFSCFRFGVRAREMGVGLYLFRPVVYTDMSEAWLLTRSQRVVTDLAGTYFGGLYILAISALALAVPSPAVLWALVLLYTGTLVNLNPFLRFDGYWVLTDWLGLVNVHRRAVALFSYHVKRLLGRHPPRLDLPVFSPWVQRALLALSCLYLVFTLAILYLGFVTLGRLFLDPVQREAFFQPILAAVWDLDPIELLRALRSGGLVSLMLFYLLMMVGSTAGGFVSRRLRRPGAAPPAAAEGGA
jgi:putative peptide zinc metalloprotease protein